jgi:uncharacterized repeat protein (TIGR01451 family)
MNIDGTYTYTPNANFNGPDVFTYQVCDVNSNCSVATVTLNITAVDDIPVAVDDVITTPEDTDLRGSVASNDAPSGDGGNTWSLVGTNGGALHGTLILNTDGTFTYVPEANYFGNDEFTYQLCDGDGDCSVGTVSITINNVNDLPVALNDVASTPEDTNMNGSVIGNDIASGDGGNAWSLVGLNGGASHGTVTMTADGRYTYSPAANFNGTDIFTYHMCDATGDCSTATVTINVTSQNDAPVAVNDTGTTLEDNALNSTVATNDSPSGDGGNAWSLVGRNGGALHGTVVMNLDGTYTYTPRANYNGTDEFTYNLCDLNGDCSVAGVSITIVSVNDLPVAVDDIVSMPEDTRLKGSVVGNDTPSGDGGNIWTLIGTNGGATHGVLTMGTGGRFIYTPDADYYGTDTFSYKLCDVDSDCSTASVTINIDPVDDAPVAVNDVSITAEDTPVSGNVSTNDTPSGDGGNRWSLAGTNGGAAHGTVIMNADGTYTYTPNANYNGADVFVYQLMDADGDVSVATVTITIIAVNDVPVAVNDAASTPKDTELDESVAGNDTPSGDGGNVWSLVGVNGGATHGTVSMGNSGTYIYTPASGYFGTDVFIYQVCDVDGNCSSALVTVTVNPVGDAPQAFDDADSTPEDNAVNGNVSSNDVPSADGGNTWSLVGTNGGAANGTVTMAADGTYIYTPNANFNGTDTFIYQLCDANGDCSVATVALTITSVNDLPVAVNDGASTPEDIAINGSVAINDNPSGEGGNVWSLVGANGGASHGTVSMTSDGRYTYTPNANFNGNDSFTYKLCDVNGDCSTATVSMSIDAVDDAPVAVNDTNTCLEDESVSGSVTGNDTPSGDGGNVWRLVGINGGAANGTVTMRTDGSYTYIPEANYHGIDVFTYEVCDIDRDCSVATVTIDVISINDVPLAENDTTQTPENIPVYGTIVGNDSPSGDGGNTWNLIGPNGGAQHGTVTLGTAGANSSALVLHLVKSVFGISSTNAGYGTYYVYYPNTNYTGTDVFTYEVCDGDGDCATARVFITIEPVDQAPVATNDIVSTPEDSPVNGNVAGNDILGSLGSNVWTLIGDNGGAGHGTVTMNPNGSYTYTPNPNFSGTDTFTYQLCSAGGYCSSATVSITINTVNDLPIVASDVASTLQNIAVSGNVTGNDVLSGDGGNHWSLSGTNGGAAHGTVTMDAGGEYTYTPTAGYSGTDVFIYQLCDGSAPADCASATVTVTITAIVIPQADLSIVKTATPRTVNAGDLATFTIAVTNLGTSDAMSVTVTDAVNASIQNPQFSTNGGATWTNWSGNYACGNLATNATFNLLIRGKVNPSLPEGSTVSNTATVTSTTSDPVAGNNSSTDQISVLAKANLSISKQGTPHPVAAGQMITYTINIYNSGPGDALNVSIADAVPSVILNPEFSTDRGTTWSPWVSPYAFGNLSATGIGRILIRGKVSSNVANGFLLRNTASVSSATSDPASGDNSATDEATVSTSSDLSLTKVSNPNPIVAGQMITYTIRVSNSGYSDAQGVVVTDAVPPTILTPEYTIDNGASWRPWVNSYTIGTITSGSSYTLLIRGIVIPGGARGLVLSNTASVTSTTADPDTGNNTVTDTNTITIPHPNLAITKEAIDNIFSSVGEIVRYRIIVYNNSEESLYNIVVADSNAVITSGSPIAILASHQAAEVFAAHTVTQADIDTGEILNAVTANGRNVSAQTVRDRSNMVTTKGLQRPQITASKYAAESRFKSVGETIHYTIEVFNCGNVTLKNITVSDPNANITGTNTIASLAPRATVSVRAEHMVTQEDIDAGKLVNIAYAKGYDPGNKPVSDESNTVTLFSNQPDQLTITKMAKENSFKQIGDTIHYEMTLKNYRSTYMSGISVFDANAVITTPTPIWRIDSDKSAIVDGCMYAVPAGMPGGGPGTLVCSERIARVLVERVPERLSLSAGCYSPQDVSRMRELKLEALRQFCEELMRGEARPVRELELEFATAQADTRPVETRGSAAGGKAA